MTPLMRIALGAAAAIVGVGVWQASRDPQVYSAPSDYRVERRIIDGNERVVVYAAVTKLLDCDLDRGDGPLWIEFENEGEDVPPISAFYRPDGTQSGSNAIRGGQSMVLDGYSATIPNRMRGFGGTFTVMIPCQLWTDGPGGTRQWGRNVLATWGPIAVPPPGMSVTSVGAKLTFTARAAAALPQ
ncbi:hypothetical protein GCM10011390_18990 [Aureimonas endophytica]|uniref:Uncharacterized protein n=1 Tax=Aureimonas endophytica TaxID=2027858 RepID=A0A916ZJY9_9HYPH|nr:hypothetical protein [Aureimonas endophytica]GGE00387.1 hypothetical protein GCM10011390_18990 [Aureimonas endophytica]